MSVSVRVVSGPHKDSDRRPVAVPAPNAHAGIAAALKASYASLPADEHLNRLLDRLR